jgi:effector-binding domain-containing protein
MVINTYTPVRKQVQPVNFLFFRTETTVGELQKFLPVAQELFSEAYENKLRITGPVHWHYFGFTVNEHKPFTLEVALPVAKVLSDYDGKFHFKRTDQFSCISLIHEGSWLEIPRSYEQLMRFATQKHLRLSGINREIYINIDFTNPDANITEIQLGLS